MRTTSRGLTAATALTALALTGAGALTLTTAASAAEASPARTAPPRLTLPEPTGPRPVGHTALRLVDRSRADPWVPDAGPRRLMVSVWYPARRDTGTPARYMTPKESTLLLKGQHVTGVPGDTLSRVRTWAYEDAAPAGRAHRLPLVVLSPGFSLPRATLTSLGADLAGRGYVVAAIDHTYESFGTTFPDGHTTTCLACAGEQSSAMARKVVRGRVADVSFVLDRLTGRHPAWRGARLIDRSRIGMAGHSIGGDTASAAMRADHRVRAGVNMDGTINTALPRRGLSRPFLLLGTEESHTPAATEDTTWKANWPRLTGWKRWITVAGTQHSSFTDLVPLADQIGVPTGTTTTGARSAAITRAYVGAFFDRTLRHRHRPILNGPSHRYPEVKFWP